MLNGLRPLRALALVVPLAVLGCHAQTPLHTSAASSSRSVQVGTQLSPDLARRVEVMIRSKANVPDDYNISVGTPQKSDFNGFDTIDISFGKVGAAPKSVAFLLSTDGNTLAQLNRFDISQEPGANIPIAGRPTRGGGANAPVTLVVFDDLECPFCAIMNAELSPAIVNRYKDQVRIVYRDFPLEQIHPWAKHAAIDAECLAAASTPGYWNFVDYVHAHAADMAGPEKSLVKANQNLDKLTLDEGTRQKVNQPQLVACVLKQDAKGVDSSILLGEADPLRLSQVPVLFINGEKIEGVVPIDTIYRTIDRALVAAGRTPPPPPPAPAPSAAAHPGS